MSNNLSDRCVLMGQHQHVQLRKAPVPDFGSDLLGNRGQILTRRDVDLVLK